MTSISFNLTGPVFFHIEGLRVMKVLYQPVNQQVILSQILIPLSFTWWQISHLLHTLTWCAHGWDETWNNQEGLLTGLTSTSSQRVYSLQQWIHVQQVVLNGGSCDSPTGLGLELTHGHGSLYPGILNIVSFIQYDSSPHYSKQRWWRTLEETQVKSSKNTGKRCVSSRNKGKQANFKDSLLSSSSRYTLK